MAETTETAILDLKIDWGSVAEQISRYQLEIDELTLSEKKLVEQQKQLDIEDKEQREEYIKLGNELANVRAKKKDLNGEVRTLSRELMNENKQHHQNGESLKQLRAQLSILTAEYDNLSKSERENKEVGGEYARQILEVTKKLKDAEFATDRYYRNVGNYENSIKSALGLNSKWAQGIQNINGLLSGGVKQAFATGATAVKAFGAELMALLAHPVVAILAIIAASIMAIVKGIQSSEENSMKLKIVLEPLNRILQWQLKLIQDLSTVLLDWAINAGKAIMKLSEWAEKLPIIGKLIKQFNDGIKASVENTKAENNLVKEQREVMVQNAKDEAEVARLRNEATKKDKYSLAERKKMLEEAISLEEEQLKRNQRLARERLKEAEFNSKKAQNDKEANEELANAQKNLFDVERDYYSGTMRLQQQRANIEKELQGDRVKNTTRTNKQIVDNTKSTINEIRKYEDILISLIVDNADRQRAQLKTQYDRQIADLEARLQKEKHLTQTILAEIQALKQKYIIDSAKLELQLTQETIQQEQKRIEILLSGAEKETQEEYNLKLQQLEQQKALDLLAIEQAQYTEEQKGELRLAIAQKYANTYDDLEKNRINAERQKSEEALRVMFETEIAKAGDNALEVARLQMELAEKQREQLMQYVGETNEAYNLRKAQADQAYLQAKQNYNAKEVEIEQAKYDAMADITDGLVQLTEQLGESDESFARASKVLALATIAIRTGEAIAKMVSAESGKGVAGLATMAGGIATILTNIASALKMVRSAKFSRGGRINGQGSSTSDSNTIRVSDGESVINARSTQMFSPILSALNQIGGGVPIEITSGSNQIGEDMLAVAFAKGASYLPNPVVAVEEIKRVGNNVQVIENLSKL